jgi:hypothetical protein
MKCSKKMSSETAPESHPSGLGVVATLAFPSTNVTVTMGVCSGSVRMPEMTAIMMVSMRIATKRIATPPKGEKYLVYNATLKDVNDDLARRIAFYVNSDCSEVDALILEIATTKIITQIW